ncbi:MAG: hypothetical protein HRT71_11535 [Flavobacteriales bacterium]|nr:hypothetical protein [Flavobacteriales bacterium]
MKKYSYFIFISCFLLQSLGCGSITKQKELAQIDALISKVEMLDKSLVALNASNLESLKSDLEEKLKYIQTYTQDTLTKEEAIAISKFSKAHQLSTKTLNDYQNILSNLEYSYQQLKKLKDDSEKELIPSDSIGIFIAEEKAAIIALENGVKIIQDQSEHCVKDYEEYSSVILRMTDELTLQLNK